MDPDITEAALDDFARDARGVHDNLQAARAAGLANGLGEFYESRM